jgi:hypothetical protein
VVYSKILLSANGRPFRQMVDASPPVVSYRSNELTSAGNGGFADTPADLTIASKLKVKNGSAIHHVVINRRILCDRCIGALLSKIEVVLYCLPLELRWRGLFGRMCGKQKNVSSGRPE